MMVQVCPGNQWGEQSFIEMVGRIREISLSEIADDGLRQATKETSVDLLNKAVIFSILSEAWPAGNA